MFNRNNIQILIHASDVARTEGLVCDRVDMLSNALRLENDAYTTQPTKLPVDSFTKFIYQVYLTIPGEMNSVVESFLGVPFTHTDSPILSILGELLSANFLQKEVREKGGAAGAGVVNDPHKCTFSLYSYRDPRNLRTYSSFEKAIVQCVNGQFE